MSTSLANLGKAKEILGLFTEKNKIPETSFNAAAVDTLIVKMKSLRETAKMEDLVKSFKQLGLSAADITQIFVDCGDESHKVREVLDDLGGTGVSVFQKMKLGAKEVGESIKGAFAKLKAFFSGPGGFVTLGAIALTAITAVAIHQYQAIDRAIDKAEESRSSYNELKSEVESLNEEYKKTAARIEYLNNLETPTLAEQDELDKLEEANALLKTQIELKDNLAKYSRQAAADDSANVLTTERSYVVGGADGATMGPDGFMIYQTGKRNILDETKAYYEELESLEKKKHELEKANIGLDPESKAYKDNATQIELISRKMGVLTSDITTNMGAIDSAYKSITEEGVTGYGELIQIVNEFYKAIAGTPTHVEEAAVEMKSAFAKALSSDKKSEGFHADMKDDFNQWLEDLSPDDFQLAYEIYLETGGALTSIAQYEAAMERAKNKTEDLLSPTESLQSKMQTLWDSEGFADSRKELVKLAKTVDGIKAKDIKALAKESDVLAEVLEADGMNAEFLAHCLQEVAEGKDGFAAITEGALDLNKALSGIAEEFNKVTEARNRYSEAMSAEEKDAGFKSYAEALETLKGEIQRGTTNSNAFWASAEMLYGEELLKSWDFSVDKIKSGVPELTKVFGNADSAGQKFLDRLYAMSQAGELEGIAEIARNATGGFDFKIDSGEIDTLAEKMNMSEEAVLACIKALSMWCDIDLYNVDEIITSTEKIGILMDYAGQRVVNLEQLMAHLEARDLNAKDIADVIDDLADKGVMILDLSADVDTLMASFQGLGVITQGGIISNDSYIQLAGFLAEIGYTRAEVEALTTRLVEAGKIDLSQMTDASLILNEIDFRDPEKGLHDVSDAIEDVDDSSISSVQSRFDKFLLTIKNIKANLYGVVDAIGDVNNSGGVNQAHKNNQNPNANVRYAKGTNHAKAGPALLGDEYSPTGEPKPELVVSGDKAYLAGVDGPVVGNLKPGDRVYTASETKKILRGRSFETIPAFAFGGIAGGSAGNAATTRDGGSKSTSAQAALDELKRDTAYWALVKKYANQIFANKLISDAGASGSRILTLRISDFIGKLSDVSKLQRLNEVPNAWGLLQRELVNGIPESVYRDAYQKSNGKSYMPARYHISNSSGAKQSVDSPVAANGDDIILDGSTSGGGYYGGGGGSSGASTQKEETAFEKAYKEHQHKRAMDQETDVEYLAWLESAYKEAYEKGEMELDDYRKYTEEVYELQKEIFQDHLSDIEHQIEGLNREAGNQAEIIALYEKMIADIESEISSAKARGLDGNSEYIQELESQLWDYKDEIADIQEEITENAQDAVDELVDYRIDMIKEELESEKDALDSRLDELQDFYDKQKQMLQDKYDEEKYLEDQAEKRKVKDDINDELNRLRFDDSAWAQRRKAELEAELAKAQKDLNSFERDHALDDALALLEKEREEQTASIEAQITALEEKLNDPKALYNKALSDIQDNTANLYEEMVEYNNRFGDGNPETVKELWDEAYKSLNEYVQLFGEAYMDVALVASSSQITSDGYASGTFSATPGLKRVNEVGPEDIFVRANGDRYRMFRGGEKVLNAKATEFLYNFATSGGAYIPELFADVVGKMRNALLENFQTNNQVVEIKTGDIIIQGNADERTVSQIRREQRAGIDYILKEFTRLNR